MSSLSLALMKWGNSVSLSSEVLPGLRASPPRILSNLRPLPADRPATYQSMSEGTNQGRATLLYLFQYKSE